MKVAALYDVHGNLPALEAVLAEADTDTDTILVGGDAVLGPMPKETLALLRGCDATFIRGNCDREVVAPPDAGDELWTQRARWVHEQLDGEELSFLRSLPHPLALDVEGLGSVLFCHGSPRSDEEILTAITPPKRLDPILDGVQQDVVVCGHTHAQFDRLVGDRRLVNAGSVGMAYEGEPGIAAWALLGPIVELRRTPYDAERAARLVRETGLPGADEFAEDTLLHPPGAEEVTAHFEALAERQAP
jgi:predicted phosphodiesterase